MSTGFQAIWDIQPVIRWLDAKKVEMERASVWAVRQAGLFAKEAMKAQAPVLKDPQYAGFSRVRRAGGFSNVSASQPIPGLLRGSIAASRTKRIGDEWEVSVGPRGWRVNLYAKKENERAHFAEAGRAAAEAAFPTIMQLAADRAWEK